MSLDPVTRINKLFAEAVFSNYKKKRYGIKSCTTSYDPDYLNDLRELQKRAAEATTCEKTIGCGQVSIEEKIKTL